MLDDIEDASPVRRGHPAAHIVFGTSQTINSATFLYAKCLESALNLSKEAVACFSEELCQLHIGQSHDLYWTYHCKVGRADDDQPHAHLLARRQRLVTDALVGGICNPGVVWHFSDQVFEGACGFWGGGEVPAKGLPTQRVIDELRVQRRRLDLAALDVGEKLRRSDLRTRWRARVRNGHLGLNPHVLGDLAAEADLVAPMVLQFPDVTAWHRERRAHHVILVSTALDLPHVPRPQLHVAATDLLAFESVNVGAERVRDGDAFALLHISIDVCRNL